VPGAPFIHNWYLIPTKHRTQHNGLLDWRLTHWGVASLLTPVTSCLHATTLCPVALSLSVASHAHSTGAIAGAILGCLAGLTLLVALAGLIAYCRRRRIKKEKKLKQANNPFTDTSRPSPRDQDKRSWLGKFTGKFEKKPAPGPAHAPRVLPGPGPAPYANGSGVYNRGPSSGPGGPLGGPGGPLSGPGGPLGGPVGPVGPDAYGPGSRSGATNGSFNSRSTPPALYASRSTPPGAAAAAATAAVGAGVLGAGALSAAASRPAVTIGFTGEELQDGLRDLKHVVTNKLLPAVDNSTMTVGEGRWHIL
jgi:hypothetical protein